VSEIKPKKIVDATGGKNPFGIAFAPDGARLAVGYNDTTAVSVLDGTTLAVLPDGTVDTRFAGNGNLSSVAWSADGTTLYAGGRYWLDDGSTPIVAWSERGRGEHKILSGPRDTVLDMVPLLDGGLAWGGGDPSFGMFDALGLPGLRRKSVMVSMRNKIFDFSAAPDATGVRYGLGNGAEDPWLFEATALSFVSSPTRPADYVIADKESLPISDWDDAYQPTIDTQVLKLDSYELSRSLAITPDKKSFFLGTEWSLYQFDAFGQQRWRIAVPSIVWALNLSSDGAIVVAALGDGTIRWYRASDGKELLAFFVHTPDKRWIAWTPTGYYAAAPGAEDLIGWHVNGKTWDKTVDWFPSSRFRDRFYRPDIVKLVLKTKDEARAVQEANAAMKRDTEKIFDIRQEAPPVVEILDPQTGTEISGEIAKITFRVRSPSGAEIEKIEVLIDGRPARARAAVTALADGTHIARIEMPPHTADVAIFAKGKGTAKGELATVTLKRPQVAAKPAAKPDVYAVVVGVGDYDASFLKLNFADNDAADFANWLDGQKGRKFGEVHMQVLLNGDRQNGKTKPATRENIDNALQWLETELRGAEHEDIGMVFFSGHGVTDDKNRFYFLPADVAVPNYRASAVSAEDLQTAVTGNSARMIFFLDACHAGEAAGPLLTHDINRVVNTFGEKQSGIMMFASSSGTQDSYESPDLQNGAFAEAVMEALNGAADADADGEVTTAELHAYLPKRIKLYSDGRQDAAIVKPDTVPDFAIAQVGP
jgi:hypothetical protein